jgi:hypothetical protein
MKPTQPIIKDVPTSDSDVHDYDWPIGFFEQAAGSIPGFPEREPQGENELRLELD